MKAIAMRGDLRLPAWLWALRVVICALALLMVLRPAHAFDDGLTDYVMVPAGSYIVNMGATPQTVANGLKPYGLVWDLVKNYRVPIAWAINPAKAKDGVDFTDPNTGISYRGSAFIIDARYVNATVVSVINTWKAKGVLVNGPTTGPIPAVPIYDYIQGVSNVVLDLQNGNIAAAFFTAAGIASTAYTYKYPSALTPCDDMFVLPHADPTWTNHGNLVNFVKEKGYLWAGCHAVSVLENLDDPTTPTVNPDMNFLSDAGLIPFGDHADGSPPYLHDWSTDPIMQFLGTTDAAQQGGSEQVFLPKAATHWRPGARMLVYDTTQADIAAGNSLGPAAAIVAGRAFDVSFYGRVMYEGGHNIGGTSAANVAAQRAFFNFWLQGLIDRSPSVRINASPTTVNEGSVVSLSAAITYPYPVTYQWVSDGGGTFSAPNSPATTFTAPEVPANTTIQIRLIVTDGCNRTAFAVQPLQVVNVAKSDLAITKSDSPDPARVGGTITYTLSVSNLGTEAATSVVVEDTLPPAAVYQSASGTGWSCSYTSPKVTCTRPTLGLTGGTPSTIAVVVAPSVAGPMTNTATVSSAMPDPNTANNSATETTQVLQGVDVAVTKTATGSSFYPGQAFSYTLTAQNIGATPATNLTVSDVLASSLAFVSAAGSGWACVYSNPDRTVTCHLASLAPGGSSSITLTVLPSGSGGDVISNTATITSPDFVDEAPTNNTSSTSITLSAPADVRLEKSGSTTGGGGGQIDTWIVTLTNLGPGTATGIAVTDRMSGSDVGKYGNTCALVPSTGTVSPASPWPNATLIAGGTWSVASLPNAGTATLTITCQGDNNAGVTNSASVTSTSYDPNTTNNQASAFVADGSANTVDITISKTDSPDPVYVGQTVTYTITVTNLSTTIDARGSFTVTDTLPPGVTYVGYNANGNGWTCTQASGVVTCTTTSDINHNTSRNLTITVLAPPSGGSITNTATVRYTPQTDQYDPIGNNTATATTTVIYQSTDIAVSKIVSNATPVLGSTVTFTITAANTGNPATNLRLKDVLPAGFSYISSTVSQGSYDRMTGLWYIGSLASPDTATLTITASVGVEAIANTACLYAVDQTDTNAANNCATAPVTPKYADLAMAKTAASPIVSLNSNAVFTVTVHNNGSSAVTSVNIQDVLPSGLEYVSSSTSSGTYVPGTGIWSIPGPVPSGGNATLTLTAKVTVTDTPLTNTALITSSGLPDPNTTNNSASATVTGAAADIQVSKTVDISAPPALNTTLTFTVTARNNGPSTASGVVLTDLLPAGLSFSSYTASQGTYTSGTGAWSVGSLTTGATATLTLKALNTVYGNLTNAVSKTAQNEYDPDATNDSASASVLSGGSADLQVTKTVDRANTFQGSQVTFTVQLRNNGPMAASGVAVTDLLPAGLAYVSHVASQGTYTSETGVWTVGSLTASQLVTLQITASAGNTGVLVNTASVSALNQADPDPTNNTASASVDAKPAADLAVTKAGPGSVPLGSSVTYTLVASNNGPGAVTGATIVDTVPSQITNVTWTCVASGTADCSTTAPGTGASGSGNAISLPSVQINAGAGNFLTITVAGTASATGTLVNTAIISPPPGDTIFDTNTANNSATVSTVVSSVLLNGRVFADTGASSGIPNDGIRNGGEIGIANVTVKLTDCNSSVYSTTTTAGDGTYSLAIPSSLAANTVLCAVETNPTGYISTGGQAGNTGGTYDRTTDRVQFTLAANTNYSSVNFADVPDNRFLTDGAKTALPGSTLSYPHVFIAGTGGQVTFSTTAAASPAITGWSETLYLDANCDGILSTPTDQLLSGAVTVTEGQRVCVIVQEFVPAGATSGASNVVSVRASFVYTNASPAILSTYTRQDVTTTSSAALELRKEVRNVTQSGAWVLSNQARDGDELEYRITYSNKAPGAIQNLVIRDMTPSFTVFVSAACGSPLPPALTMCTVTQPAPSSANGSIQWQFSGSLSSGGSGTVTYRVKLQ